MKFDKSKAFSAINADEIKPGAKGYYADNIKDLMEAVEHSFKNSYGEISEIRIGNFESRFAIKNVGPCNLFYLIEEPVEKKLRPFKDVNELFSEWAKRAGKSIYFIDMPTIWLKHKTTKTSYLIVSYSKIYINFLNISYTMQSIFDNYTFNDGSPCGVEE